MLRRQIFAFSYMLIAFASACSPDLTTDAGDGAAEGEGEGEGEDLARCEPACGASRICRAGACVVDLDPGDARDATDLDAWQSLWALYDVRYAGFVDKPEIDWDVVFADVAAAVSASTTKFEAEWAMAQGIARLHDGHTAYYSDTLCGLDPGYGAAVSNVGACVVEADGGVFVATVVDNPLGLVPGDQLLALDGRDIEQAIADVEAQPRCAIAASTAAQARSTAIASLLLRARGDVLTVRRRSGEVVELTIGQTLAPLRCDGRVPPDDVEQRGAGVETTVLAGDVLYVHFPLFGSQEQGRLVDGPIIEALRGVFDEARTRTGVVLDLRSNGGGYPTVYMALASWLLDAPTVLFSCASKSGEAHDALDIEFEQTSSVDSGLQVGVPLVVITNARSFSAADFTPMWLQGTGRARLLGEPTGGGFGSGDGIAVDGGFAGYSSIACRDLDGAPLEGHPPAVDLPVVFDPADLAEGVDTLIVAARAAVLDEAAP